MEDDISIGVAREAAIVRDLDAAENEASTLLEAVAVVADSDAHRTETTHSQRVDRYRAHRHGDACGVYGVAMTDVDISLADWLSTREAGSDRFTQTVAGVAERARAGEDFFVAVRELLDEVALLTEDRQRESALAERPGETGERRFDAFLGALAEHLAASWGLPRPPWAIEGARFLDRFWFYSDVPAFRPLQLAQSPAAFRRRGIFISAGALERV